MLVFDLTPHNTLLDRARRVQGVNYDTTFAPTGLLVATDKHATWGSDALAAQTLYAITVELWVTVVAITLHGVFLSCDVAINGAGVFRLQQLSTNAQFLWDISTASGNDVSVACPTTFEVGKRYHLVGTYSYGDSRLYVNGVQVAQTATATGNLLTPTVPIYAGRCLGGYYSNAILHRVRVWANECFPPAKVWQLYNQLHRRKSNE